MALTDNLISYWKTDGNSTDSTGTNNGTDTNVTYVAGKIGSASSYAGNGAINLSTTSTITNQFTFSFWMNCTDVTARQGIFAKGDGAGFASDSWVIEVGRTSGKVSMFLPNAGSVLVTSTSSVVNNTWAFIVCTYDGVNIKIIINNGTPDSTARTGNINNITAATTWGRYGSYVGLFYTGLIDEMGVWNRVITASEITQLYNGGAGLSYTFGEKKVKALVVGAGGSSGGGTLSVVYNSGGGGGQVTYNSSLTVTPQAYAVIVGAGVPGANNANGVNGNNSTFATLTGIGGKGATVASATVSKGGDSGSGFIGGSSTTGGSSGASDTSNGNSASSFATGANGLNGTSNSISGIAEIYGSSGGGAAGTTGGTGGTNAGSGFGGAGPGAGTSGTVNKGGGSGGSVNTTGDVSGSGIVIISYTTNGSDGVSPTSTGGTITTSGGQTIHTFTTNGTFTMIAFTGTTSNLIIFF